MDTIIRLKEEGEYDRMKDFEAFTESRGGVKGLVDSGIQNIPRLFIRTHEELLDEAKYSPQADVQVPVIDLGGNREKIVGEVKRASKEWGFFVVVNHGIPVEVLDQMIDGVRRFHEQDVEAKKQFDNQKVKYITNKHLYKSRAANWRDSLRVSLSIGHQIEPHELPQICRDPIINYINQVTELGETLFELLSEALGLNAQHLGRKGLELGRDRAFTGHYYPSCPQPDLTMGTTKHTDPCFLTILLQDHIGGLQFLPHNQYINLKPLSGSLVVNIGDKLQMISNDEFISTNHRVLANRLGPRISVAGFFNGSVSPEKIYAPIQELKSVKDRPKYKEFTVKDYLSQFFLRPIDKSGVDEFKLQE